MANNSQIGSPKESKICANIKIMINTIEPLIIGLMEFSPLEFFSTEISVLSLYLDMDDNSIDSFFSACSFYHPLSSIDSPSFSN